MKITRVGGLAALLLLAACGSSSPHAAPFPTGYRQTPATVAKGLHGYCASLEASGPTGRCLHTAANSPAVLVQTYPSADQEQLTLAAINNGLSTDVPTLCRVVLPGVMLQGDPANALRQAVGNVTTFAHANHGTVQGTGC